MNAVREQYFQMLVDQRFGGYTLVAIEQAILVDIFKHINDDHQTQMRLTSYEYKWDDFKKMCVHVFPKANLNDDDHLSDFITILQQIFQSDGVAVDNSFNNTVTFDFGYKAFDD